MSNRLPILLILLIASATATLAQYNTPPAKQNNSPIISKATCPWLTTGSVARVFGGDVSVSVSATDGNNGFCKFLKLQDSRNSLEVQVSKTSLTSCPGEHTRLVGIGNEAAQCRLPASNGEIIEMVSSRVRDVRFNVTLTIFGQRVPAKAPYEPEVTLEQIAEQIAGNLY
jgi:hypothetical protein